MKLSTVTADEARREAAAAGFDSLESAVVEFINQPQVQSMWQSFLSSRKEAQLRSRFESAGLWSKWESGGDALVRAVRDFPADLWARHGICPPQRTIMLAATSKSIRGLLAQMQRRVPARVEVKQVEGMDAGLQLSLIHI